VTALDREISQAFGLLGLLLVFVLGFFSAFLPLVEELINRDVPPSASDEERRQVLVRLQTYRRLVGGLSVLTLLVLSVLWPVTRRVAAAWRWSGPFPTIRAGLLMVDLMLLLLLVLTVWLLVRLGNRIGRLKGPVGYPSP
jgi:uncharacterized BrkB/YihY/UPF0761 family membrane protein